jgi:hypothetical protein
MRLKLLGLGFKGDGFFREYGQREKATARASHSPASASASASASAWVDI